jgi:retron-type reverse transcriptase
MKSDNALLRLMNLPVFSNEEEMASLIHVHAKRIRLLSTFPYRYYRRYKLPKSKGGFREIKQPSKDLKGIQAWILRNILDRLSPSPFATAYVKKKNIADNVLPHRSNRYFLCLDLEDFFPSISIRRVSKIFSTIGYSKRAAILLARLCTCSEGRYFERSSPAFEGNLPQGAITSPSLSNLISAKLDRRIAGYTSRRNIIYTRYADDITLSSNNPKVLCQALPRILKIIKSDHFTPNMDKLRVLGPRRNCSITGLVKDNSESKFGIGRKKKRQMRAIIHHFLFDLSKDDKYKSEGSIVGWLNYLKGIDSKSFEQMNKYWNRLRNKCAST